MQLMRWIALFCALSLPVTQALSVVSADEHSRQQDEVRATVLTPAHRHKLSLPVPPGAADGDATLLREGVQAISMNPEVASATATAVWERKRLLLPSGPSSGLLQCEVASVCHAPGLAHFRLDFSPLSYQLHMPSMFLAKWLQSAMHLGLHIFAWTSLLSLTSSIC